MKAKYTLSDPYLDFTSPEDKEVLANIITKQGKGLSSNELTIVFQKYCPAGTYAECLNYLPLAFHDIKEHLEGSEDLWENVLFWITCNKNNLLQDGLYETYLQLSKCCIDHYLLKEWDFSHDIDEIYQRARQLVIALNAELIRDLQPNFACALFNTIKNEQSEKNMILILYFYLCAHEKTGDLRQFSSDFDHVFPYTYLLLIKNSLEERMVKHYSTIPVQLDYLIRDCEMYLYS